MALSYCIGTYYSQALTHQEGRALLKSNPSAWRGSAGKAGVAFYPRFLIIFPGEIKALNFGARPHSFKNLVLFSTGH